MIMVIKLMKMVIKEEWIPFDGIDSRFLIPNSLESRNHFFFLESIPSPNRSLYIIHYCLALHSQNLYG